MTFDELIVQLQGEHQARLAEIYARTSERDAAQAQLYNAQSELITADNIAAALQAQLDECRNPTPPPPPVVRVPVGPYSGTMQELAAREQQLGVTFPSTWFFAFMDTVVKPTMALDRDDFDLFFNVHPRIGKDHDLPNNGGAIQWRTVADTTLYDARLIALMKSIDSLTKARIWLKVQEEMDGSDGSRHGTSDEYKRFFRKVYAFAKMYCPRAKVGMAFAKADRAGNFVVPEAEFLASDPHYYDYNGTTGLPNKPPVVDVFKYEYDALMAVGLGTKPYFIHTGISEPMTEAQAIAAGFANGAGSQPGNITAGNVLHSDPAMKIRIVREELKPFLTAVLPWRKPDGISIWDRSTLTNNRAADERINSSLGDNGTASLAAFKELMTP